MNQRNPEWLEYETTVFNFLKSIDPSLDIKHNQFLPDIDTGHPRQRDIVINVVIAKIFKIRIMISCKNKSRKLSEQDIDAFIGELRSSGAQQGAIFSKKGFTKLAIEKCRKLSISCCQVFDNNKIVLPKEISIFSAYCYYPSICIQIESLEDVDNVIKTWHDFFYLQDEDKSTVISHICNSIKENIQKTISDNQGKPLSFYITSELLLDKPNKVKALFKTCVKYRIFAARQSFILGNGIYEYTEKKYIGGYCTPSIDRFSDNPGNGWEEISENDIYQKQIDASIIFQYDYEKALENSLGKSKMCCLTHAST